MMYKRDTQKWEPLGVVLCWQSRDKTQSTRGKGRNAWRRIDVVPFMMSDE